jgi:glycopeptide antibiotics resistance protein
LPPLPDAVANVLLFLPWGFLLALHLSRRGKGLYQTILLGAVTAFGVSAVVESLQLLSHSRMTSATDLVNNAGGGFLGSGVGWVVGARLRSSMGSLLRRELARRPLTVLALAVALFTVFWAVSPYDLSFDVDYLKGSIKATRLVPFGAPLRGAAPAENLWERLSEFLAWTLIGGVIGLAARAERWSGRRLVTRGCAVVLALAAGTELVQLLVRSRTSDATTVLFSFLGGGSGVLLVLRARNPDIKRLGMAAIVVWVTTTLVSGLSPWRFGLPPHASPEIWRLTPFIHHFLRTNVYALTDTMMQMLFYAPLGILIAARSSAPTARASVLIACCVAGAVELAQILIPERTPDTTDVALGGIGAALGFRVWRWAVAERRKVISAVTASVRRAAAVERPTAPAALVGGATSGPRTGS